MIRIGEMTVYRILLRKHVGKWMLGSYVVSVGDGSGLCPLMYFGSGSVEPSFSLAIALAKLNRKLHAVIVTGLLVPFFFHVYHIFQVSGNLEIGREVLYWVEDRVSWRAFVIMVINLWVAY